ncbi:MAG: helix-turn-helix domain-containing protein, partial [Ruminococcus sp.]|nr:helix-turn-helix domain-containing protein [Ruminococcus sp.]
EQVISALMSSGTIKDAAAATGLSERTIYDRMNKGSFQALYMAAKADLVRAAVFNMTSQLQTAISTIIEIMQNTDTSPAIRLQAAQTILNHAGKFAERLQADETRVTDQVESNRFDPFC